jgi:hypothetical protein
MTGNGVVTAGAMLFCQDTSYICVRARGCACVCVCDVFEWEGNLFSGKSMCFSRGDHMVIRSNAK